MNRTSARLAMILALTGLAAVCSAQVDPANPPPQTAGPADPGPAGVVTFGAAEPVPEIAPGDLASARIDVVFVLDTTGSMSGLIEGAKQKIWSIANAMATAKPRPEIRLGLVGYRDIGDEYVTIVTPLTDDLDAVYTALMAYQAGGGGDGPESVNQALNEAVTKFDWSASGDALKLVYLVGDAPPHMDYEQDVKYMDSCRMAAERGLIVNTIQCGTWSETTPIWQEIARLAEGEYFAIEQSGGVVAIATPYDEELATLGADLSATLIAYGDAEAQTATMSKQSAARAIADAAPPEAMAERACYMVGGAGKATMVGRQELCQDVADGKVQLASLQESELPPELKDLTPAQRERYVQDRIARRADIQKQIEDLAARRAEFIQAELASRPAAADSFDAQVLGCLERQAARKGIVYTPASGGK